MMATVKQRDGLIDAAIRNLDEARRRLVAALDADETLEHVDRIGFRLAQAADQASFASQFVTEWRDHQRRVRRDYDRAVAEEADNG